MAREYRIIGPPGTGKSTRLTRLCQLAAPKFGVENILICSLTKAAAAAIANKSWRGQRIVVPRNHIGTLHSFAYRALDAPEIVETQKGIKAFNEWLVEQRQPGYALSLEETDLDDAAVETNLGGTTGDKLLRDYQISRARLIPVESLREGVRGFANFWERYKAECGGMDFTDLLEKAWENVDAAPGRPKVFMMDEAQDMAKVGMRLARKWGEADGIEWFFTVGDPLQNLYFFAGAEQEAFTGARLEAKRQEVLAQSWRVPLAVKEYAIKWVAPLKKKIEEQLGVEIEYQPRKEFLGEKEDGEPILGDVIPGIVRNISSNHRYPKAVIDDVEKQISNGREAMILTACSYMLVPIIRELRSRGLPFHNIYRIKRGDWNPLNRGHGVSAAYKLARFLCLDSRLWDGSDLRLWTAIEIKNWLMYCRSDGLLKRGSKAWVEARAKRPTISSEDGDIHSALSLSEVLELFENQDEIVDLLMNIESGSDKALSWLEGKLLASKKASLDYPLAIARRGEPRLLTEKPLITVGTIHSLKGTEASCVYVFPDLSFSAAQNWVTPGEGHDSIIRAFYVAFTRARDELVLCQPSSPCAVRFPSI